MKMNINYKLCQFFSDYHGIKMSAGDYGLKRIGNDVNVDRLRDIIRNEIHDSNLRFKDTRKFSIRGELFIKFMSLNTWLALFLAHHEEQIEGDANLHK